MSQEDDNRRHSHLSDSWIELHSIPSADNAGNSRDVHASHQHHHRIEPSSIRGPGLPKLRLDTSNLSPPRPDRERSASPGPDEPAPKSAILGLAKGDNLVIDNWLPESKRGKSNQKLSPISPSKVIRRRSSHSSVTSARRSSDYLRSVSSGSRSEDAAVRATESSPRLSPLSHASGTSNDGVPGRPTTPIPQLVLTVERSFQHRGEDTPLTSGDHAENSAGYFASPGSAVSPKTPAEAGPSGGVAAGGRAGNDRLGVRSGSGSGPERVNTLHPQETHKSQRNVSSESLLHPLFSQSPSGKRAHSGRQSPQHHHQPAHNLTLSGAAYAAQQDFLDAEEENRSVRTTLDEELEEDEETWSSINEYTNDDISVSDHSQTGDNQIEYHLNEPIGRTLFCFDSKNPFRKLVFRIMVSQLIRYVEIALTLVQVIGLSVELRNPFSVGHGLPNVLNSNAEHLFIGLYSVFTLMALAKCVAFGVVTNEILTLAESKRQALWIIRRALNFLTLGSIKNPREKRMSRSRFSSHMCFLRKSWGRVEFISIIFFWCMIGVLTQKQIYSLDLIVGGLGHLRILHLLDEFVYTRIVLHVIKAAIPFLQNVLIFIGFFLAVWGVIGLQSFNGSLRRICIYDGDVITSQNCGSWLDPTTNKTMPYMLLDSAHGTYQNQSTTKGYTCPIGSKCVELRAFPPYGSFSEMANMSFDNIFNSLEIVFIMMSTNGFTPIMYDIIDSEYLASSLFFIFGVLILGIWLMNLLVAVMVSSYVSVRHQFDDTFSDTVLYSWSLKLWDASLGRIVNRSSESRESLTPTEEVSPKGLSPAIEFEGDSGKTTFRDRNQHGKWILRNTKWGKRYSMVYPVFAVLALLDLIVQAAKTPSEHNLFEWELSLAIVFGVEILVRFWVFLPYWRYFFFSLTNLFDLTLAIANCVILPFYHDDELYAWLTVFQLLRVYRLVGTLKYSRTFWLQVFGNFKALASLTAFFFSITFLCTLIATKMLRGQFPMESDGNINTASFYDLAVSFFSMYQIASTENWTDVLFWVTENVKRPGDNVLGLACMGILFCGWLFFANFLIFNLFVGIMSESLHGAISNKRGEQVKQFLDEVKENNLNQRGPLFRHAFNLSGIEDEDEFMVRPVKFREKIMATLMRWTSWREKNDEKPLMASHPIQAAIERKFVVEFLEAHENLERTENDALEVGKSTFLSLPGDNEASYGFESYSSLPFIKKLKVWGHKVFSLFHHYPEDYRLFLYQRLEHPDRTGENYKEYVEGMFDYNTHAMSILEEYCKEHPRFDTSLFLFSNGSFIRRFCQRLVAPSNGARLSKVYPRKWVGFYVRVFFIAATVSIVVQTCVNTPLNALNDQSKDPHAVWTYSKVLDLVYGIIFTIEFLVKVIADGFHFTPNAYTWSTWNCLDFVVLISIWMTFINDLVNGVLSRYLRALLALRALRLISFFRQSELLLSSVFIYGLRNVLGACLITLSIVIPYAVWGKNIFHDRLKQCNDDGVNYLSECGGEYVATVFDNFEMLAPRVVQENYFSYNNFWQALLIQFGVLSLEGWIDVLQAVTSITGKNQQPSTYASKGNAAYPILYHYIGAVLIMTMLIAVIIRNYALTVGTAFLTEQQLSWLDVKRTLQLIKPTPRPPKYKYGSLRHHLLTVIPTWITSIEVWTLFVATVDLAAYFYPLTRTATKVYQLILIACSLLLVILSLIRLIVLQPTLYFHNWWNPFGLAVSTAVTIITIVTYSLLNHEAAGALSANRAADICLLLLWIPRTKKLYQFYAIGTAAISEISMLLRAWFALYLTYAIAFNQSFGLTKLGTQSTWSRNFRTIPKALIALFTMSCGEGWNEFLIDFTIAKPYCIDNSTKSECGIPGFAYFLFISWNILSMYVFANLFISLICEACWYLYRSGPVNISEQDIVSLLENWQQFDPRGTAFIRTRDLHNFLGRSQGYFSMGIFSNDLEYNVHHIVSETQKGTRTLIDPYNVDMDAINQYLSKMDVQKYREKRILYELFTTQAEQMSYAFPGGRGIRFSQLVLMFPLYQDMNPSDTLTLKEFLALKVQLHEARVILAANFIIRKWRLKSRVDREKDMHKRETPGVGYDQSWSQSKHGSPVYWVS